MKIMLRILLKLGLIDRQAYWRRKGATIGAGCAIMGEVCLDPGHERYITIGENVTIAPQVYILAHDASTKRALGITKRARVVIHDRVFIGAGVMIMPGVTIGEGSIIGAGSVVTANVPAGVVSCGNPSAIKTDVASFLERRRQDHADHRHEYVV